MRAGARCSIFRGTPGRLDGYTTLVTVVIDTAVIVPAAIVTGLLIWRHRVVGYLVAVPLLILEAMLAPLIVAQTISQKLSGVVLLPGEVVDLLSLIHI